MLEALDEGRLRDRSPGHAAGARLLADPRRRRAEIEIGEGCFLNRNTMIAARTRPIGDHTMFANGCFVGDAEHRFDDPDLPVTWQGFTCKGPVEIGSNCWFGVNCAVASGVRVGERCVIGANSVVRATSSRRRSPPARRRRVLRKIEFKPGAAGQEG